jgi:DNA-binding Lrp family transcriptional regulator
MSKKFMELKYYMFNSTQNIKRMSSMSRKLPKNDVTNVRIGTRNNLKNPNENTKGNQNQRMGNSDNFVPLVTNTPGYENEEDFDVKTAKAKNNERNLISVLDKINLKIIEELLNNGDIKSSEIASKLAIPLSTIQRRRAKIEKTIFRKTYEMSLVQLGFRTALIFADIQKGKAKETGEKLLKRYNKYILRASTRINSSNNLCLEIVYNNSEELHSLLEEIKGLPMTTRVDWSEQVYMIGDNVSNIINFALSRKMKELEKERI